MSVSGPWVQRPSYCVPNSSSYSPFLPRRAAPQEILAAKAAGIMALQRKVEGFKAKLQEEELMSRTARPLKGKGYPYN